jgi:hypothetical protein
MWNESYMFRTINISKLLGEALGAEFGNMLFKNEDEPELAKKRNDHIEISCPIFLRPLMKKILSVGKSIKIVRFLEDSQISTKRVRSTLDYHQGIDYQNLQNKNMRQIKVNLPTRADRQNPVDYQAFPLKDSASFQMETIANKFIDTPNQIESEQIEFPNKLIKRDL